jgi:hypothetical protein
VQSAGERTGMFSKCVICDNTYRIGVEFSSVGVTNFFTAAVLIVFVDTSSAQTERVFHYFVTYSPYGKMCQLL